MTLTKADIIEEVAKASGFSRQKAVHVVEVLLEIIKGTLERGDDLLVSGFGKFSVKRKAQRMGRNPKTGEDAVVSQRKIVRFKCSGKLRDKINERLT
jgi:integration host factor subunit alpha